MTATPSAVVDRDSLQHTWENRPGILGWLSVVNHKDVGRRFIWTALVFFLLGGVQALLIRTQLAVPDNDLIGPQAYNELFTMHGTTMMFLFIVPMLEGLAMYFVPMMLGARDMPFPRLNAFGYWLYLAGGLFIYASFLTGDVPDGGWFAYVPLTGAEFSPGRNLDFWLLGVSFLEVSGILAAIELIVLVVKHKAPGMALHRLPVFAWSALVMSVMILFAFPVLLTASMLLELERKFGLAFYDPGRDGEPLLWQHLFWIFGHPEVYIQFIPAAGIVSTIVPTFARRPLVAYPYVVASLVAIGIASFGLWVHHMFSAGLPLLASSFFTAASLLIAIPSGVQIFAWIATLWGGVTRWASPLLFMVGFGVIFVLGGITGVMVAVVPFDWQVHDSFFVVAHFHYVLIGGVVFPIVGGLHYWLPKITGRMLNEPLAKVTFWLMFIGFNVGFFPQHVLGLDGMPRRIYSYREGFGWSALNMVSTVGAFVLGLGFMLFVVNILWSQRRGAPAGDDPWEAPTLEWSTESPAPPYNFAVPPYVDDRYPRWNPADASKHPEWHTLSASLTRAHGGRRETIGTSTLDARPDEIVLIERPSLLPLATAVGVTVSAAGALVDNVPVAIAGVVFALAALTAWLWPIPHEEEGEE